MGLKLHELTEVKPDDDLLDVLTADRINAIQDALRAIARGENIGRGIGVRKTNVGDGYILHADPKAGGAADQTSYPFKVAKVPGGAAANDSVNVLAGYLANIVIPMANYLTPDITTPTSDCYVCIEVTVVADAVSAASIVVLSPEDSEALALPGNTVTGGVFRIPLATLQLHQETIEEVDRTRITSIEPLWKSGNIFNLIVSSSMAFYW